MTFDSANYILGVVVAAAPALLVIVLGTASLLRIRMSETFVNRAGQSVVIVGLLAAIAIFAGMLISGSRNVPVSLGQWVAIPEYHFTFKLVFDRLSIPFAILSYVLVGTIGAFASSYMHRELGYTRFFVLYALFLLGIVTTTLAGTVETLFAGWELVGLSSALLVAYYHERPAPVRNGLRVWAIYRVSDAALLLAAIVLHHLHGEGDFSGLILSGSWPDGEAAVSGSSAFLVGILLVIAAAGKSALIPFSGWLPRAMEGPTPSSAIFYGALSVHLGAFLLMRVSPLLEASVPLQVIVVVLGISTACFASLAGRVQTDIKSALSFASLAQVGIIVAEVGVGLRYVALVHLLGHACLRTLQFIRAPNLFKDYHSLENALGNRLSMGQELAAEREASAVRRWLFRLGMERGYFDVILADYFCDPLLKFFRGCDRLEQAWLRFLSGNDRGESAGQSLPPADRRTQRG